jgi:hypothetical protein
MKKLVCILFLLSLSYSQDIFNSPWAGQGGYHIGSMHYDRNGNYIGMESGGIFYGSNLNNSGYKIGNFYIQNGQITAIDYEIPLYNIRNNANPHKQVVETDPRLKINTEIARDYTLKKAFRKLFEDKFTGKTEKQIKSELNKMSIYEIDLMLKVFDLK